MTPSDDELATLLGQARMGHEPAFEALFQLLRPRVEGTVRAQLRGPLREKLGVDDLVQEIFLEFWKAVHDFDWKGQEAFAGWLRTIARRVIGKRLRVLRARKRRADREIPLPNGNGDGIRELADLLRKSSASPSKVLRRDERFRRLKEALRTLAPDHRQVIFLTRIKQLPIAEVARTMERSPGAVSMLLLRALRKLREAFGATESLSLPPRSLGEEDDGR